MQDPSNHGGTFRVRRMGHAEVEDSKVLLQNQSGRSVGMRVMRAVVLAAVWIVVGPVALALDWVEDQTRLAAELFPMSLGALAEALLAIALGPHLAGVVALPEGVAGVWSVGGGGGRGGLAVAVLVVVVADRTSTAHNPLGPVTPLVSRIVEQLLAVPDVAGLFLRDALVALVVLDAVVAVGEEAVVCGAGEVDGRGVGFAGAAVAIAIAAHDVLGEVAPLVHVVVQVVLLAQQMARAALVTLPVHGAVVGVGIEEWSVSLRAGLVVGQSVVAPHGHGGGLANQNGGHQRCQGHATRHPDYVKIASAFC